MAYFLPRFCHECGREVTSNPFYSPKGRLFHQKCAGAYLARLKQHAISESWWYIKERW